jgi:hypothetical protein
MKPNQMMWLLSSLVANSTQNTIPTTTATESQEQTTSTMDWAPIGLYNIMKHCVQQPDMFTCFKKLIIVQLNEAIQNSETWQVNRFVTFKKDPNWVDDDNSTYLSEARTFSGGVSIMEKLKDLVSSRMVQISLGGTETLVEEGTFQLRLEVKSYYLYLSESIPTFSLSGVHNGTNFQSD